MADEPENLVLKQLAQLREAMDARFDKIESRLAAVESKLGGMAQTLVSVERDIRRLTASVATLGAAVDEHTNRLDHIEERLGIERPNPFPPA